MPSGKQATKQAARKRPAAKKTAPKKTAAKKKIHKKSPLRPSIGVVTSIALDQALRDAFEDGINNANVTIQYEPNPPSYDMNKLVDAVRGFNDPTRFGLIVTVGGVGAATAALNKATKVPWLALIGGTLGLPAQPSGKFFGGVNLDSYGQNAARIGHLNGPSHHIPSTAICLLYNPNSTCSATEVAEWQGVQAVPAWAGDNDANKYPQAFGSIPNSIRVVVISADPYFQQTKEDLIKAANVWIDAGANRRVCYPLQEYANTGHTPPHAGRHTLHGPDLVKAYTKMGTKARNVLRTGRQSTLEKLSPGNPHDG
jgi:hypothetical protein